MADTLAELNIGYPDSPLTVEGAHRASATKPGTRWPERLPADTSKARFTAIGPADVVGRARGEVSQAGPGGTRRPSQADARDLILVRPDGYVGFAGAASDRAGAEAYLRGIAA